MSSYSAHSMSSYANNNDSHIPMAGASSFSIENREVRGDGPVYLGTLVRIGNSKKGPRSMKLENE